MSVFLWTGTANLRLINRSWEILRSLRNSQALYAMNTHKSQVWIYYHNDFEYWRSCAFFLCNILHVQNGGNHLLLNHINIFQLNALNVTERYVRLGMHSIITINLIIKNKQVNTWTRIRNTGGKETWLTVDT